MIELPYIKDFNEKDIPTKSKSIHMSQELEDHCKKEIQELLEKKLIRSSKSPWSCSAFYVMNQAEIERGALRLPTPTSPANIPRSPLTNPEFHVNPNKQVIKILEPIEEQKLSQSFNILLEYLFPQVIKESQADKAAVDRYHNSLISRTTTASPSSSTSGSSMTNKEIAQRIKDYSNNEALLENFINEIRGSPTPSENLFQDSQDPYEDENFLNM
ncbi:hypothetical protein Tco_0446420 [Tanacetum coccineum]